MARLFSIEIPFNNKLYCALVCVREFEENLNCQVRYIDKGLQEIFAGDVLVFNLKEGLKQPCHLPNDLAEELVRCTSEAISGHFERPT